MRILTALLISFVAALGMQARDGAVQHHRGHINGQYMITFSEAVSRQNYTAVLAQMRSVHGCRVVHEWSAQPYGVVCAGLTTGAAESLARDPRIAEVEEDFEFVLSGAQLATFQPDPVNQPNWWEYQWYLDRIDEPNYLQNDGWYNMCPEGRPIVNYVLDIGVRADHEQFIDPGSGSRVVHSRQFADAGTPVGGGVDTSNGCSTNANSWHGTAVAAIAAGTSIGGAKTNVVSLRYTTCDGTIAVASSLVNAVRWIRGATDPYRWQAAVVTYSGGVPQWDGEFNTLNTAVRALVTERGAPFFTSAENFSGDACIFAPNSMAYTRANRNTVSEGVVMSVGGTSLGADNDRNDYRWQEWEVVGGQTLPRISRPQDSGSNGGRCVSVYAPAAAFFVASNGGPTAYQPNRWSGSSWSAPLVAAVAARHMTRTGMTDWRGVYDYIIDAAASTGTVVNNVGTPEYWLCTATGGANPFYRGQWTSAPCPTGYGTPGGGGGTAPLRIPATNNESQAGIVYSNMSCP